MPIEDEDLEGWPAYETVQAEWAAQQQHKFELLRARRGRCGLMTWTTLCRASSASATVNELRHALKRRERLGSDTPFNVIFFRPPGVGKTELAKYLSAWRSGLTFEEVNSAEGRITIFDMGAFKDEVSVNTFFGAHAGFQGGEGKLYKALRCNPRGVFIFDEVEKAHSKVFDSLLPLMNRNGWIQSNQAGYDPIATRDAIFIFTSNIGAERLESIDADLEPETVKTAILREVRHRFSAAFCDRIDLNLFFHGLSAREQQLIALNLLDRLRAQLIQNENPLRLTWEPRIVDEIARDGLSRQDSLGVVFDELPQ